MKVGSVDDNASIGNLTLIETMGKDTWKLKGTYFMYDYTDLSKSDERGVIIDPNFPYVYIPDSDFLRFAEQISNNYDKDHIECFYSRGYCKINNTCEGESNYTNWRIYVTVSDGKQSYSLNVADNNGSLLVNGSIFDDSDFCYIPVFRSMLDQETWYLGGLFLQQYYITYDMTPIDEFKKDYIQVGIAPLNQSWNGPAANYDKTSLDYIWDFRIKL